MGDAEDGGVHEGVHQTNRGRVALRGWDVGWRVIHRLLKQDWTCQHGLGSYKSVRAGRPVNVPLLMTVILLLIKVL